MSSDPGKVGKEIQLASPRATTVGCVDPGAGELSAPEFVNVNLKAYTSGDLYAQKVSKKITPAPATQIPVQVSVNILRNYFPERHMTTRGGYHPSSATGTDHHQQAYLAPTPTGVHQAIRPTTSPISQAYYGVQRMVQEAYWEQLVYNAVPQQQQQRVIGRAYHEEVGLQDASCGSMLRALPKEGRVQSSL